MFRIQPLGQRIAIFFRTKIHVQSCPQSGKNFKMYVYYVKFQYSESYKKCFITTCCRIEKIRLMIETEKQFIEGVVSIQCIVREVESEKK